MFKKKKYNNLVALNCPKCGGLLHFDGSNHTTCEYCGMSYSIDPGTTTVRIRITEDEPEKKTSSHLPVMIGIAALVLLIVLVVLINTNKTVYRAYHKTCFLMEDWLAHNEKRDTVKVSLSKIFDKDYKDITQKEKNQIKYFSLEKDKDGKDLAYICGYSFEDYKDYDSFEEFENTIKEARIPVSKAVDSKNFIMLKGLTCYREEDNLFAQRVFDDSAPITCLIGEITLEEIGNHVDPSHIERLDIRPEKEIDLGELRRFKNLKEVRLDDLFGKLESLDGLEKCSKIEKLCLENTLDLTDLSALEEMSQLKELVLNSCVVEDVDFLEDMPCLEKCSLGYVKAIDLDPFLEANELKSLSLNGIKDYSCLQNLHHLESLTINYDNEYPGAEYIEQMNSLKSLTITCDYNLSRRGLVDLNSLSALTKLESFSVQGSRSQTGRYYGIPQMLNIESLKNVAFSYVDLDMDINEIKENNHVTSITMYETEDSNEDSDSFAFLNLFTGVKELSMMSCDLEDIQFTQNMKELEVCNVEHNYISDYSPLAQIHTLTRVYCGDNSSVDTQLSKDVMVECKPIHQIEEW